MVSSVLVEFVADAGEAPSSTKSGDEGGNCISGRDVASGVCEEGIAGMKIESHVTVPCWHVQTHIAGNWGLRDTPEIYKKARYNTTRAFWSLATTQ